VSTPDGGFTEIDAVTIADPGTAFVYEHGWQSWSPTRCHRPAATSARPSHAWQQAMRFRPETAAPSTGFQAEGLLIVGPGGDAPLCIYTAARPEVEVPSVRATLDGNTIRVATDGDVRITSAGADLNTALGDVGDELAGHFGARPRPTPTVWCYWYHNFLGVTEADIIENLQAIRRHELPVEVVQVDDGWETCVGDWTTLSERFTSTRDLAGRIQEHGRRAGIWLAPFIAGTDSALAREHPDWLVGDAGYNWDQSLRGLDLTHPDVRDHLTEVFTGLREQGFDYFKLDFLYGGALPGQRRGGQSPVEAYRSGLALVRDAVGPEAHIVGCGAPILPSIGLVDAMRVSADTYNPDDPDNGSDVLRGKAAIEARAWQQGRLWVNDPDCLVARPRFSQREEWAKVIEAYGGLRSVSDRIAELDDWGIDTTRRVLAEAPPPVPFATLPALIPRA
jgi:alpha-galactosidase